MALPNLPSTLRGQLLQPFAWKRPRPWAPGGVHDPEIITLDPERQTAKPGKNSCRLLRRALHLGPRGSGLPQILLGMRAQVRARIVGIGVHSLARRDPHGRRKWSRARKT
jgi:hypothetical protein